MPLHVGSAINVLSEMCIAYDTSEGTCITYVVKNDLEMNEKFVESTITHLLHDFRIKIN